MNIGVECAESAPPSTGLFLPSVNYPYGSYEAGIVTEFHELILKKQKWMLVPSEEANEEMTLVFYYPRAFDYKDYLRPQIKLEFGRGDQQPSEKAPVVSFV